MPCSSTSTGPAPASRYEMPFDWRGANRAMRSSSMVRYSAPMARRAEIVGGGFAGLAAACALASRGWRVRLHERADRLRTAGAGINIYENGLRVLEALGALEETLADNARHVVRETRDEHDRLLSTHPWHIRVYGVLRQRMIDALAAAARRAGTEIVLNSTGVTASASGELVLVSGERIKADLVVAADGVNSSLRDSLGLVRSRRYLPDGAIRVLIPKLSADEATDGRTIEYWSGSRRFLYNPCSRAWRYLALRSLRIHPPQALVHGACRGDRRRRARHSAEHRPGCGLRHDERALDGRVPRTRRRHPGAARRLGARRTAAHQPYAAHLAALRHAGLLAAEAARALLSAPPPPSPASPPSPPPPPPS